MKTIVTIQNLDNILFPNDILKTISQLEKNGTNREDIILEIPLHIQAEIFKFINIGGTLPTPVGPMYSLFGCKVRHPNQTKQNRVFITSDHHFFHKNVITYEARPFEDVEHMNKKLINNWNKVISKNDKVFHLGDFSFANKEKTKEIVSKLNGYKILIMGNHDKSRKPSFYLECGFNEVYKWPIIYCQWYILSHEPVYLEKNSPYINIHGHVHSKKYEGTSHINVCVENTEYYPVLFSDILLKRKKEGL